jgi:hypothetical protein
MPTPATLAEAESLFSGHGSPVPSLDIRQQRFGADSAIPGLDINPPEVPDEEGRAEGEGVGGWISNLVKNARGGKGNDDDGQSGKYKKVDQDDAE